MRGVEPKGSDLHYMFIQHVPGYRSRMLEDLDCVTTTQRALTVSWSASSAT